MRVTKPLLGNVWDLSKPVGISVLSSQWTIRLISNAARPIPLWVSSDFEEVLKFGGVDRETEQRKPGTNQDVGPHGAVQRLTFLNRLPDSQTLFFSFQLLCMAGCLHRQCGRAGKICRKRNQGPSPSIHVPFLEFEFCAISRSLFGAS